MKNEDEEKMLQEFNELERERQIIEQGGHEMQTVKREDVRLRSRGKNDYNRLAVAVKKVSSGQQDWIVEVSEKEVYETLGGTPRKHISSKYGLAVQIGKELSEIMKTTVHCGFTNKQKLFYISSSKLSG